MKTICIQVGDSGELSIGVEPQSEESMESEGGMEDDSYLEPVADERELMMRLKELLQQPEDPEAESGFEGGFSKAMGGM